MEAADLVQQLALPSKSIVDLNFPKNAFYQQANLNKAERSFLKESKAKIRLLATLRPQDIGIPAYEDEQYRYEEIQYLYFRLVNQEDAEMFSHLFFKYIPYPMVLLFTCDSKTQVVMAATQKGKQGRLTVEGVVRSEWKDTHQETEWIESLAFTKQQTAHLKAYYDSLISRLIQVELEVAIDKEANALELYRKIEWLNAEIEKLTSLVKKEKQMNKRIALQLELTRLKEQRNKLLMSATHN